MLILPPSLSLSLPPSLKIKCRHMGSCQNYAPFWGTLNIRCRIIIRTQKETLILTTPHMLTHRSKSWTYRAPCNSRGSFARSRASGSHGGPRQRWQRPIRWCCQFLPRFPGSCRFSRFCKDFWHLQRGFQGFIRLQGFV